MRTRTALCPFKRYPTIQKTGCRPGMEQLHARWNALRNNVQRMLLTFPLGLPALKSSPNSKQVHALSTRSVPIYDTKLVYI